MKNDEIIFFTYFDINFLLKGLALRSSLIKHNPNAKLWVLAFDKYTEEILNKMKLKGVTVVPFSDFEDKDLKAIKHTRSRVEYIWTCTPSWPLYVFNQNPSTKLVVYLDGDLYFYSSSTLAVNEIKDKSILAVEHRFPKGREHLSKSAGRFNVAFNVFRKDEIGIKCLKRWREQCIDWCYWKLEDGKLGDQMYLDEWPKLYKDNLIISKNIGVDAAPWNIFQYKVSNKNENVFLNNEKLICYHFHQFQILGPDHFSRVLGYTLSSDIVNNIYKPYEEELRKQYAIVKKYDTNFEIKPPQNNENKTQMLRQRLAKYFGPFYWKIKGWLRN